MEKFKFTVSWQEVRHIAAALVALSFAFSLILFQKQIFGSGVKFLSVLEAYPVYFVESLVAVGFGFVLHEMAHKYLAQKKGLWAEFRAWPMGLALAAGLALLSAGSFVFAAPGAVMISPMRKTGLGYEVKVLTPEDSGKISIVGSVVNVVLAGAFSLLFLATGFMIFGISAQVNAWLALFNMIPISLLDGAKVFRWSKFIWGGFFALCVALFALTVLV